MRYLNECDSSHNNQITDYRTNYTENKIHKINTAVNWQKSIYSQDNTITINFWRVGMKEYKVIINTETGEVCSVETFVRNVNEEHKSAYTVGKIYGASDETSAIQEPDQSNMTLSGLFNRISALEEARDTMRATLERNIFDPRRIRILEEARENQAQINDTMNTAYEELRQYTLLQIDNIIQELYIHKKRLEEHLGLNSDLNLKTQRGHPKKTIKKIPEPDEKEEAVRRLAILETRSGLNEQPKDKKRGRGRPNSAAISVKSKKRGRGRPKKGTK